MHNLFFLSLLLLLSKNGDNAENCVEEDHRVGYENELVVLEKFHPIVE